MMNLVAIQERFDARAAAALEKLIEEVEASGEVRAVALRVLLLPDRHPGRDPGTSVPTIEVNLTLEMAKPGTGMGRRAGTPGRQAVHDHPKVH